MLEGGTEIGRGDTHTHTHTHTHTSWGRLEDETGFWCDLRWFGGRLGCVKIAVELWRISCLSNKESRWTIMFRYNYFSSLLWLRLVVWNFTCCNFDGRVWRSKVNAGLAGNLSFPNRISRADMNLILSIPSFFVVWNLFLYWKSPLSSKQKRNC
jgi:hypothetical protein